MAPLSYKSSEYAFVWKERHRKGALWQQELTVFVCGVHLMKRESQPTQARARKDRQCRILDDGIPRYGGGIEPRQLSHSNIALHDAIESRPGRPIHTPPH